MMSDQKIECPKCGTEIPLTEALTGQIEQSIKLRYEAEAAEKTKELDEEKKILKQRAKEIEAKGRAIDEEVAEQLKTERKEIVAAERKKIIAEQSEQTKALEDELAEKNKKIAESNRKELELLKKGRELEEKGERLELEVERKLSEERKKIAEEAGKKAAEENLLKLREKDDMVITLRKQLEDMQRRMEQGSQERQGEMMEEALKEVLERKFCYDRFEDVPKGKRGADIVQVVSGPGGKVCGKILWESKNTKEFSKGWIGKLKKDQSDAGAEFAILMTVAMPREVRDFDYYDDVWVTNYRSAIGLCTSLRQTLISVARQKAVAVGQASMKDIVYEYVTGVDFSRRIKSIVNAYTQMQGDLESERRAMQKIWKKREKQIGVVLDNAVEMRGEIEGLVSGYKELPGIEGLTLDGIVEEPDESVQCKLGDGV